MSTQRYSVTPHAIETLLTWVKSGEIAIPEIQRPFVWDATKVRNLLDSLYQGYPVGYLVVGREVLTKDYDTVRMKIAIHPQEERFEVANPAIRKDVAWVEDVATVFAPDASLVDLTDTY